jgi:hypothetical protein
VGNVFEAITVLILLKQRQDESATVLTDDDYFNELIDALAE